MSEFLRITDGDAIWICGPDDLPLPLVHPSPLPDGWMYTGEGWDYVIECKEEDHDLEIWHLKRVI